MRIGSRALLWLISLLATYPCAATAAISSFRHVVVIVQENRTPDNLFHALCANPDSCSTTPNASQYDIQVANWRDNTSPTKVRQPFSVPLANSYDLGHGHRDFLNMCDRNSATGTCNMDGAAKVACAFACIAHPQFAYVDNSTGAINPYLVLATEYGWANRMFQTNQGPSFPAHQFLFGATSAPNAADDHAGIFASENMSLGAGVGAGCAAVTSQRVQLITSDGVEWPGNVVFPCFEHETLGDLLSEHGFSWKYYTPSAPSIWTAPNAIHHICQPVGSLCTGPAWRANVDLVAADVLADIGRCALRDVTWVIPTAQNSDHAESNTGGGPSWVSSVVNAIGSSSCKDGSLSYWNDTAIFITWDDWGGWYDHVVPPTLPPPENGYQYGFRVPLVVVSAYTPTRYIDNNTYDFGSIVRFIEHNSLIRMGALTFADARSKTDLLHFFKFAQAPRPFHAISAPHDARYFLNDKSPQLPPDDD